MYAKRFSLARILLLAGSFSGLVLAVTPSQAQNDPPPGDARLAHLLGNVSYQPANVDQWGQAEPNMLVGQGDRVFGDHLGRGELQASRVRSYFIDYADLTLIRNDFQGVELGLANGTLVTYSDGFESGRSFSIQTPNGAITAPNRASFRVQVYPDQQSLVVTNYPNSSVLQFNGAGGFYLQLQPGESVQLAGTNPVYAQPLAPNPPDEDEFGRWSAGLETMRFNSISLRYVSPEMPGYDELDNAGDWRPQSDYGPIWFPRVQVGWAPYHNGHWVNRPFYGWTWVADEPWGAAPFHYGRWVVVEGRWGWIPGAREAHPIWSPAQVVFAGGIQVGGVGVSAWFPLGPGEPYKPWYPCSPTYINQVNITNIHESRVVHVQTTYVNVVNVTNVTNITYVNRTVGVTAMRQEDFAAGHPAQTVAVKVSPQQVEHIQPAAPAVRPPAQPLILHPVARPAAVPQQRPVLINNKGLQAAAVPNAKPVVVPVKAAPPAPKPLPGHTAIGTPTLGGKPVAAPPKTAAQPAQPAVAPGKPSAPPAKATAEPAKPAPQPAPQPVPQRPQPTTQTAKPAPQPVQPKPQPTIQTAKPAPQPVQPKPQPQPAVESPRNTPPPPKPAPEPNKPAVQQPRPAVNAPAPKPNPPAPKPNPPAPREAAPAPRPQPPAPATRPANPPQQKPANPANKPGGNPQKKDEKKPPE